MGVASEILTNNGVKVILHPIERVRKPKLSIGRILQVKEGTMREKCSKARDCFVAGPGGGRSVVH